MLQNCIHFMNIEVKSNRNCQMEGNDNSPRGPKIFQDCLFGKIYFLIKAAVSYDIQIGIVLQLRKAPETF